MTNNKYINNTMVLYFILYLIMCYMFSPGFMTKDSIVQLYQAEKGILDDWHPPVMSLLWSFLILPFGTGGMLYFQLSVLFFSCYLMSKTFNFSKFGCVFLFVPFLPWIFNFEFVIWKDVELAYSWFLSIALAIYCKYNKSSKLLIFLLFSSFLYGLLVRSNSPAAAVFLLPFLMCCIFNLTVKKSIVISFMFVVFYFLFVPRLFNELVGAKKSNALAYMMIDDIVAIKLEGGKEFDLSLFTSQDMKKYKDCPRLRSYKVGAGSCDYKKMKYIIKNNYSELKDEWVYNVTNNLFIYIKYRIRLFIDTLRGPLSEPYYYYENTLLSPPYYIVDDEVFNHVKITSVISGKSGQVLLYKYVTMTNKWFSFVFKPFFWIVVSLCQLIFFVVNRTMYSIPFWMLPLSSISYVLGYIPFTQAHDLRYFYYSILVATVCCFFILILNIKSGLLSVVKKI